MKHSKGYDSDMAINEMAQTIITKAMKRELSRSKVSSFYGIPPTIVDNYLLGIDCGTLYARDVVRVEIARTRALAEGKTNFRPTKKDHYKGTR